MHVERMNSFMISRTKHVSDVMSFNFNQSFLGGPQLSKLFVISCDIYTRISVAILVTRALLFWDQEVDCYLHLVRDVHDFFVLD
jgi:hypothetical protein